MTGVVAIDVAIGLVFVYLLYSLLATIFCEIIASYLGLRARNLREAIIRLLEDDPSPARWKINSIIRSILHSIATLVSRPGKKFVKAFYEQATIKYLSRNDFFSSPSYISPSDFSKALIEIFREHGSKAPDPSDLSKIKEVLDKQTWIDTKTREHIRSLLTDANNDLSKFKTLLERWYDHTMERAIGWYKQKIQIVLLIIGLALAITFNVSTIHVVNVLSKDDKSRDQLVKMATAYLENHKADTVQPKNSNGNIDSLLQIKKQLETDISSSNSIMGLGWNIADSADIRPVTEIDTLKKQKIKFITVVLRDSSSMLLLIPKGLDLETTLSLLYTCDKKNVVEGFNKAKTKIDIGWWLYFWKGVKKNFWGYIITALAISLGSPFWFDLLSKLVQIRGSVRQPVQTAASNSSGADGVDLTQRKG